jgi:vacuolar-type H+-ATPase subunit I/STV1
MIRSETVDRYKIIIPKENSWEILNEFGMMGHVQFESPKHLNSEREKLFVKMAKHAEEVLRSLSGIEEFMKDQQQGSVKPANFDLYLSNLKNIVKASGLTNKNYFSHVAETVHRFSDDISKNTHAMNKLIEDLIKAEEELVVNQTLKASLPENYM